MSYNIITGFIRKKIFCSFRRKMTIKIAILNTYITSTNFVVSFFFLSGPVRLKNYLTSGKNNSDVDDNVVQENLSKL